MDWRHFEELAVAGRNIYGAMLNLITWVKTNAGQGSFYRSQHELIGVCHHRRRVSCAQGRQGVSAKPIPIHIGGHLSQIKVIHSNSARYCAYRAGFWSSPLSRSGWRGSVLLGTSGIVSGKRPPPAGGLFHSEWCVLTGDRKQNSLLHILTMPSVVFSGPATLMNVQHSLDDDPDLPENEYEVITCLACTKLHLINRKTGQILGQDRPRR